jgi:hypothetical protein
MRPAAMAQVHKVIFRHSAEAQTSSRVFGQVCLIEIFSLFGFARRDVVATEPHDTTMRPIHIALRAISPNSGSRKYSVLPARIG